MRKFFRPKDVLMLGIAGLLDVYEELKDPFGIGAESAKKLYGFVPKRFKRHNFSRLVEERLKTGEIEKVVKKGEVFLRLTSAGHEKIVRDFPILSMQKRKWDGKWRVVIFDISELNRTSRDTLRRKLKELGFGMLQESVWISPHDFSLTLGEFLEARKLPARVFILEVSELLAGDKTFLVNKVWGINAVHRRYWEILVRIENWKRMYVACNDRDKIHTNVRLENNRKLKNDKLIISEDLKKLMEEETEIKREFIEIILDDPMLPVKLLPKGWLGQRVRREIRKLRL